MCITYNRSIFGFITCKSHGVVKQRTLLTTITKTLPRLSNLYFVVLRKATLDNISRICFPCFYATLCEAYFSGLVELLCRGRSVFVIVNPVAMSASSGLVDVTYVPTKFDDSVNNNNNNNKNLPDIVETKVVGRVRRKSFVKDAGLRGWTVCIAACLTYGMICGTCKSYGIFFSYLTETFHESQTSRFLLSLPGSLCIGVTWMFSPLASILVGKYGTRTVVFGGLLLASSGIFASQYTHTDTGVSIVFMCLTYGLCTGFGFSLAFSPSVAILGDYFEKRLGAANGIVTSGCSFFVFLYPMTASPLLNEYGLDFTLKILSSLIALLSLCSLCFKPTTASKLKKKMMEAQGGKESPSSLLKNNTFMYWTSAVVLGHLGYFVPFVHLVSMMERKIPHQNIKVLLTCIGGGSVIGRLVFGRISDCKFINRVVLHGIAHVMLGLFLISYTLTSNYRIAISLSCLFGLFDGCVFVLLGPICSDLVGEKHASHAIGFNFGLCSIPLALGPSIAGYMYDFFGGYKIAFRVASATLILSGVTMFCVSRSQEKKCCHHQEVPQNSGQTQLESIEIIKVST